MRNTEPHLLFLLLAVLTVALACNLFSFSKETQTEPPAEQPTVSLFQTTDSEPSLCSDPQPPLVTDFVVRQIPLSSAPQARVPFRDPLFGACIVRVTDRTSDLTESGDSAGMKNEYSRVQSFNADESRILVRGIAGTWYIYDAHTLQPLGQLPLDIDPRWSASDPNLIYYFSDTRLMLYDIQGGEQAAVHDFAADFPGQKLTAVWTRYEGSPSFDGRIWGLMADHADWLVAAYDV